MATETAEAQREPEGASARAGQDTAHDPLLSGASSGGIQTFRSLRHREYRLLWTGTLFSSSGQWIQQVTLGWLVYDLTGSAFLLGLINGLRSVPLLVLGPFGGVAADRFDRKRLMLLTQIGLGLSAAIFATVIVTGHVEVWHVALFAIVSGVGWAFNMPVRQSIVPNLVPRSDLMNAMALNSAGFNITRIAGPALAGLMIAEVGPGENFYIQAAAYAAVTFLVLQLRLPEIPRGPNRSVMGGLRDGASFVWTHPTLRTQMTLALVPVVIALPYISLMPVFAEDVLDVGPGGFGLLMAAPGIGAVLATLTIASLGNVEHKGRLLLVAVFTLGASLVLFSLSRYFVLSLAILVLVGGTQMLYMTTNQTVLQLTTPDEYRGRVMGIYMLNQGLLPLGSLFAGTVADLFSAPLAVFIMGMLVCTLAALFALRSPTIRGL